MEIMISSQTKYQKPVDKPETRKNMRVEASQRRRRHHPDPAVARFAALA